MIRAVVLSLLPACNSLMMLTRSPYFGSSMKHFAESEKFVLQSNVSALDVWTLPCCESCKARRRTQFLRVFPVILLHLVVFVFPYMHRYGKGARFLCMFSNHSSFLPCCAMGVLSALLPPLFFNVFLASGRLGRTRRNSRDRWWWYQ
jgi:hypothetical protein